MPLPQLTIILPCFNSGPFIAKSIDTLVTDLNATGIAHEIIAVNDGSTDNTAEQLSLIQDPQVQVLTMSCNSGKGAAIKEGLKHARAPNIIFTDDEIPYGTDPILHCYEELLSGATLVIGDRTLPDSRIATRVPWMRRFISAGLVLLIRWLLFSKGMLDTQCGLKGFTAPFASKALRCSRIDRFAFDLELIAIATENGVPITHIPVVMWEKLNVRPHLFFDSVLVLRDILRIVWNRHRGYYRTHQENRQTGTPPQRKL